MEALASVVAVCAAALLALRWWLAFRVRESERARLHLLDEKRIDGESAGAVAVAALAKRVGDLEAWKNSQVLRAVRGG